MRGARSLTIFPFFLAVFRDIRVLLYWFSCSAIKLLKSGANLEVVKELLHELA